MSGTAVTRTDRAVGALLGGAVGDALGAPYEFQPGGLYRADFPEPVLEGAGEMRGGGPWGPGEFTDDTQMAVALAESLLAHGGIDAADLWARWRAWASTAKDVGVLTRHALAHPTPHGAAARAHERNHGRSAGNGTIMRNAPVVLFTLQVPVDDALGLSRQQAALTHHDPDTHTGAALHTAMVRAAIDGHDMFDALDGLLAQLPPDERATWSALLGPDWRPERATTPNGTVWTCLAQAVWCLRRADGFDDAVVRAVDLGDDADTVACVAGSLAGAQWGIGAVPERWLRDLHGTLSTPDGDRTYAATDLVDLAHRLIAH